MCVCACVHVFFLVPGLSRHLGSPVCLFIFFLHVALFVMLSYFSTRLCHISITGIFGRPLLFCGMSTPIILLIMCSSFILITWPYHFSRFSVIFMDAYATLVVPLMCSFLILSLLDTTHIHLSILIQFTSSCTSCPFVVALQFHWHPSVTQHSTTSLPVSPCCTHTLCDFCCDASCLFHA